MPQLLMPHSRLDVKSHSIIRKAALYLALLIMAFGPLIAEAVVTSRPSPVDSRLRFITYHPNDIHKYVGFYGYQASILLSAGEEVATITMGNTQAWQIVPSGNRIFIKPVADSREDTITNMLLITNKRTYHFILEGNDVNPDLKMNDPELVWETRFVYPDEQSEAVQSFGQSAIPDVTVEPELYNFNYTISGQSEVAPLQVFDDGEFTYFKFSNINSEIPAFFLVDSEGRESLVNYRVADNHVIIERVTSVFTLRHGSDAMCVFNEKMPYVKKKR